VVVCFASLNCLKALKQRPVPLESVAGQVVFLRKALPETQGRIQGATTAPQNPVAQWRQQLAADTVSAAAVGYRPSL